VSEEGEDVVFLHRVVPGGADQSYGVHVAQLAGMPRPVVDRARELLRQLEEQGSDFELPTTKKRKQQAKEGSAQMSMFNEAPHPALAALRALAVDELSPIEALTKLYELKRMSEE
jgi:DNA mismatch repair protein MutS